MAKKNFDSIEQPKEPITANLDGWEVRGYHAEFFKGVVQNHTERSYHDIHITIGLYEGGTLLKTEDVVIDDLPPLSKKEFDVYAGSYEVGSAGIISVKCREC